MLKWKTNLAQDSDGLYNAQQLINQLTQGLPLANESTVQLADTHLGENSDWSKINYNEYYLFDSLTGLNAPDKQSLIYDRGLTIKIGDSNEFIQLAITQDGIGVKYNNTNWSYLLNGSGGSGSSGNYVVDNKDGTVYFNGVTVTLATSKDVQSLTNLINLKQDKLTYIPADDTKVVHTTDMRKPASEVASIDEVTDKQDAIGYAPANDTNVVHKTNDEEIAGQKTFDNTPIDKTANSPYATNSYVSSAINTGINSATTAANTYTDSKISASEDTGWIDSQINYTKQDGEWLKQRVKNGILYIIGNLRVIGNTTDLTTNMGVKINPSWKLPSPMVENYYTNMSSNIQTTQKPGNAGTGWVCFNNSISVNKGYLLSFVTSNGESVQVAINLAIPID